MIAVALVSQTLRSAECVSFLSHESGRWLVVTADEHGFEKVDLPPQTEVVMLESSLAGSKDRLQSSFRRSAIGWMRGGSRIGRMTENGLRRIRRLTSPAPQTNPTGAPSSDRLDLHTNKVVSFLETHLETEPISEIVVFDLFDLPAALAFGDQHGVPVSVR